MLRRRSGYEIAIIVIVVGLALYAGATLSAGRMRVVKETLMRNELSMLRMAVATYKMNLQRFPSSLEDLARESYDEGGEVRPFVDPSPEIRNGRMVDPFGHPYDYDKEKGMLFSTSSGYVGW